MRTVGVVRRELNGSTSSAREDARLQELRSQLTTQVTVEDVKFPDLSGSRSHPFTSTPTSTSIDCGESLNVQEIAELEGELGTMIRNRKKSKAWKKLEREKSVQRQ